MGIVHERARKHKIVREYLQAHRLDGVLLSRRCNFSWYTCGAHNYVSAACDVGNSSLLVSKDAAVVITSNIESPRLRDEELAGSGIEVVEYPYHDASQQEKVFVEAVGSMRVAADAAPPAPAPKLPTLDEDFDRLRWALSEWEIERYRALYADTLAALEGVARAASPGQSENDLSGQLAAELRRRNCVPWVLLVAGDERAEKFRHPLPTDKIVRKYFMLVVCAERDGLISAATRMASFGAISDDLARKHQAVVTIDAAMILSTVPGASLADIYAEAQAAYAETGFADQWRLHHQGGSCGYQPREVVADPAQETVALSEQAFAWNPSITGTKSEDTILCRRSGPELLCQSDDWPTIRAQWKGKTLARPAILIR